MSSSKLSSFFRSSLKLSKKATSSNSSSSPQHSSARPAQIIKQLKSVISAGTSEKELTTLDTNLSKYFNLGKPPAATKKSSLKQTGDVTISSLKMDDGKDSDSSPQSVMRNQITDVLSGDKNTENSCLDVPWINSDILNNSCTNRISSRRREILRARKTNVTYKNSQGHRILKIMKMLPNKLGDPFQIITKLGQKPDVNVYIATISGHIQKARDAEDEEVALEEIYKVFELFKSMKEHGVELEDNTYGQFLMFLIDMRLVEEFYLFSSLIKDQNSKSIAKLGYYEMLLFAKSGNTKKIRDLCEHAITDEAEDKDDLIGNYLLALRASESVWQKEILLLLEAIDVKSISSLNLRRDFFNCLAQLQLESSAEKFLLTLKNSDVGSEVSSLILDYALGLPKLLVKDVIYKYRSLHEKLEVKPLSGSFGKLIRYCCMSQKVYVAIELLDEMCENGLEVLPEVILSILRASEDSDEFSLVHGIYSVICRHKLVTNAEVFKPMINMATSLKDFTFAYDLLKEMELLNLQPTSSMYNSIMRGYFREGNTSQALVVLKHMEAAKVKPDSQTYCYLISNSNCVNNVEKYSEEMKDKGMHFTKYIYMALVNAYAGHGHIEKAKQVISESRIQKKDLNEIKSVLVQAIALNGHLTDALDLYNEIKQGGGSLEPQPLVIIMEMIPRDGDLNLLLQLLKELETSTYWNQGCCHALLHSFRQKNLSVTADLINQFKDNVKNDESAMRSMIYEVFSLIPEEDPSLLQTGLELFQIIKNEIGFPFLRRILDFLLNGCVNARDSESARAIWKEYESNGLHYNVLSYLGMYHVLLACGESTSAKSILKKIPQDDSHIRCILKEYRRIYSKSVPQDSKKKSKKSKN